MFYFIVSPLYKKVELDDMDKLSFSIGKEEKCKFVVSGFARKEFKEATNSGWIFLFLFCTQTLCVLWKHSSFLLPNLYEKHLWSCYHQQKY